jgi:hypothetical protein
VERGARYVAFAVVTLGLFWAANSLAGEVGVARAYADARDFAGLPEVVLYTKEPLSDAPPETRYARPRQIGDLPPPLPEPAGFCSPRSGACSSSR